MRRIGHVEQLARPLSTAASGSGAAASRTATGSAHRTPSTAAASTSARVGAVQAAWRAADEFTERPGRRRSGAWSSSAHSAAGNSSSTASACSGLPAVPSRSRAAAPAPQWLAEPLGERPQVVAAQAVQPQHRAPGPAHHPMQAVGQLSLLPGGDDDEHLVGDQPAQRERDRACRRRVGPGGVVEHHDDRAGLLQRAEHIEKAHPDGDRLVRGRRRQVPPGGSGAAPELGDDAVRQQRLRLVTARPQHPHRAAARRRTARRAAASRRFPGGPTTAMLPADHRRLRRRSGPTGGRASGMRPTNPAVPAARRPIALLSRRSRA